MACDGEASILRRTWPTRDFCTTRKKNRIEGRAFICSVLIEGWSWRFQASCQTGYTWLLPVFFFAANILCFRYGNGILIARRQVVAARRMFQCCYYDIRLVTDPFLGVGPTYYLVNYLPNFCLWGINMKSGWDFKQTLVRSSSKHVSFSVVYDVLVLDINCLQDST